MWPMKLDLTRDECRGILRRLELESYASVVSAFRAQGTLTQSKRGILDELRRIFHISQDRHKAEARRVANDEKLGTVAETISGPNTRQEWMREGRRLFPVLPRTPPYTAYTILANAVAEEVTKQNDKLPHPMETRREMLPDGDPTLPPKPVVTEDPLFAFMHQNHTKRDLKRPHMFDSDVEIKDDVDTSSMDELASPVKRRGQLYKHLQAPQKPMHHSNSKIQQLYQMNPVKATKSKAKSSTKKAAGKRQSHPKSPTKATKSPQPSTSKANNRNNVRTLHSYASPPPSNPSLFEPSTSYQILPSSTTKKDIEYNLTKLHPAAQSPPITSTILHRSLTRKDDPNVVRNELDDISALNAVQQKIINSIDSHIPDPKIIFSTVPTQDNVPSSSILDQNPILKSTLTANAIKLSPNAVQVSTIPGRSNYKIIAPAPSNQSGPIVTSKVIIKPPTTPITGITPIKGTNKISIQNLKLTPLNSVQLKNNILTLPVVHSSLNPGQKVTIPKNIISNGAQSSNLNNIVVFDICPDQKIGKVVTNNNILNNKTVITEEDSTTTPVGFQWSDIIDEDTPVDLIDAAPPLATTNNKIIKLNHNNNSNTMETDWELELDQANQASKQVKQQVMTDEEHFNAVIEEDNSADDDMIIEETNDEESNIIIYEDTKSNDDNFEQFIEENVDQEDDEVEEGIDDEDDAMTTNGEEIDVVGDDLPKVKTNRMYNNVINAGHV